MSSDFKPHQQWKVELAGGKLVLETDADDLIAALSFLPNGSGQPLTEDNIIDFLKEHDVVYGLNEVAIEGLREQSAAAKKPIQRVIVAKGDAPVEGHPSYLEYPVMDRIPKREDDPDDPIRLSEMYIVNVLEGETAAVYHPIQEGTPGMSIQGKTIAVAKVDDLAPKVGENLRLEYRDFVAEVDGRLLVGEKKVSVAPDLVFEKDLSIVFGDVDFVGKLIVGGNIEAGITVRCRKDIEVEGSIIGSDVYTDGDLQVGKGIVGSEDTVIEVRGSLAANYVENANLRIWGECQIRGSFVTSELLCSDKLDMTEGRGHFVSGVASARNGIFVQAVGIEVGTKARLSVGRDTLAKERTEELEEILERYEDQLKSINEVDKKAGPMTKVYQTLTPKKQNEIELLLEQIPVLEKAISIAREEHGQLSKRLAPAYDAQVAVYGRIYTDAIVEFPLGYQRVTTAMSGVLFRYNDMRAKVEAVPAA